MTHLPNIDKGICAQTIKYVLKITEFLTANQVKNAIKLTTIFTVVA